MLKATITMNSEAAPFSGAFGKATAPLYTDLYQLTMLQACWGEPSISRPS